MTKSGKISWIDVLVFDRAFLTQPVHLRRRLGIKKHLQKHIATSIVNSAGSHSNVDWHIYKYIPTSIKCTSKLGEMESKCIGKKEMEIFHVKFWQKVWGFSSNLMLHIFLKNL